MSTKVLDLKAITDLVSQDYSSCYVAQAWNTYHMQRSGWISEKLELRNYIFATDTRTTSNQVLPWKNSTTIPKLCQIRDNLHSNYISALFPNDNWLSWVAFSAEAALKQKSRAILAYMENKCRESNYRTEMSRIVYDYIDYGNAFCTVNFETSYKEMADGTIVPDYIGPKLVRVSPLDIVFNPLASEFSKTWKIIRSVKSLGDIAKLALEQPTETKWAEALVRRREIQRYLGGLSMEDFNKACGYAADGFGSMFEYYLGDQMEILEFYGDIYSGDGELQTDMLVTVVDRSYTVRQEKIPSWMGGAPIWHCGWRFRQDNLWAMGPLDNLVGMQYRIDHLENIKADAMDLIVHPPLKIVGDVEEFTWGPSSEIHLSEGGDVQPLSANFNGIAVAQSQIAELENRMELYAGAPREAMGVRTPGEKTAFEVGQLQTAAGRIFQEKCTNLEINLSEQALNGMLEIARRNMDGTDVIRVMDDDVGVQEFLTVTKEDITANGKIRPVGARHFAKQAQDLQNLIGVFNSPIAQMIAPHTSGIALTEVINDYIGLSAYNIFQPNIAVTEQHDTQTLVQQSQEDQQVQAKMPSEVGV